MDPEGLVLAPANLVAPDAPGVAIRYGDWNIAATINSITVHASPTIGAPASATYTGGVLAVDGYLDIAVVLIEAPGVTFAAVPASTATRNVGEKVVVIDAGAARPRRQHHADGLRGHDHRAGHVLPDPGRSGLARHGCPGLRPPGRRRGGHRCVGPRPRPPDLEPGVRAGGDGLGLAAVADQPGPRRGRDPAPRTRRRMSSPAPAPRPTRPVAGSPRTTRAPRARPTWSTATRRAPTRSPPPGMPPG